MSPVIAIIHSGKLASCDNATRHRLKPYRKGSSGPVREQRIVIITRKSCPAPTRRRECPSDGPSFLNPRRTQGRWADTCPKCQ